MFLFTAFFIPEWYWYLSAFPVIVSALYQASQGHQHFANERGADMLVTPFHCAIACFAILSDTTC